jgi:hypothetical protein
MGADCSAGEGLLYRVLLSDQEVEGSSVREGT